MKNINDKSEEKVNEAVQKFCRRRYARKRFPNEGDLAFLDHVAHDYPSADIRNISKQALQKIIAIEKTFHG